MKKIEHKGRAYLVCAPRLFNGGPKITCDAWTTKVLREGKGHKRVYPNNQVKGVLLLADLAVLFLEGFGETYD
jgi:hypothetical protein